MAASGGGKKLLIVNCDKIHFSRGAAKALLISAADKRQGQSGFAQAAREEKKRSPRRFSSGRGGEPPRQGSGGGGKRQQEKPISAEAAVGRRKSVTSVRRRAARPRVSPRSPGLTRPQPADGRRCVLLPPPSESDAAPRSGCLQPVPRSRSWELYPRARCSAHCRGVTPPGSA